MKNKILKITEAEFEEVKEKIDFDNTFLAEHDGSAILDENRNNTANVASL
ncbi:MAG: hypothetical protein ACI4HO_02420 [Ruminococcus sp.]